MAARRGALPLFNSNWRSGVAVTSGLPNGSATPRPILGPFHASAASHRRPRLIFTGHRHLPNGVGDGPVENDVGSSGIHLPSSDEEEV